MQTFKFRSAGPFVLALGGELKNTVCFTNADTAFVSSEIGDLKDLDTYNKFKENIASLEAELGIEPEVIAYDLHPAYLSSGYANDLPAILKKVPIQHHKAHIAACITENDIEGPVIGFAFDGTGYGDDGKVWGGEVFVGDCKDLNRVYHLDYLPMPGGDKAALEPWRMAVSYIYRAVPEMVEDYAKRYKDHKAITSMIKKKVNSPLTSSMGRLFDAVSSIVGLCDVNEFEADAAICLEKACMGSCNNKPYSYILKSGIIDVSSMIEQILASNETVEIIAKRFHSTIADIILSVCKEVSTKTSIKTVTLSGGVFLNKVLTDHLKIILPKDGFQVYTHQKLSPGDSSISLGQAAIVREA